MRLCVRFAALVHIKAADFHSGGFRGIVGDFQPLVEVGLAVVVGVVLLEQFWCRTRRAVEEAFLRGQDRLLRSEAFGLLPALAGQRLHVGLALVHVYLAVAVHVVLRHDQIDLFGRSVR